MAREYKRFLPNGSNYQRKTKNKRGQEVVKPLKKDDFEEMVRLCLAHRDEAEKGSNEYFRWYRNYILLIVGVNTGNRIGTIIEQVPRDYAGGEYTVTEHKTGKRQQFALNQEVYKIIKDYIDEFNFGQYDFMFPKTINSKDAITRMAAWKMIKQLVEEANIEYAVGCHSLRKSYGRWIWDDTHDLLLVQQLLQHSSAETTMTYIGLERNDIQKVRSKIEHLPDY